MRRYFWASLLLLGVIGCGSPASSDAPAPKILTEKDVPQPKPTPNTPPRTYVTPGDEAVTALQETAVSELIAKLKTPESRDAAARALALRGPAVAQELIAALDDPQAEVRAAAAFSLGQLSQDGSAALPALRAKAEKDDSELVRDAATFAADAIEGK
ncbi:MAG TPA: HEAT repeat domain-containing protein [Pirellulaceae bacterium]|nr:HEAT repeat domain-containing protein [Pirellulaceae bacterium]